MSKIILIAICSIAALFVFSKCVCGGEDDARLAIEKITPKSNLYIMSRIVEDYEYTEEYEITNTQSTVSNWWFFSPAAPVASTLASDSIKHFKYISLSKRLCYFVDMAKFKDIISVNVDTLHISSLYQITGCDVVKYKDDVAKTDDDNYWPKDKGNQLVNQIHNRFDSIIEADKPIVVEKAKTKLEKFYTKLGYTIIFE